MTARPTRYAELARMAIAKHQQLGVALEHAIAQAIEAAVNENIGEALDFPAIKTSNIGMRRTALFLAHHGAATPSQVDHALRLGRSGSGKCLKRLVRDGVAVRVGKGLYRLAAGRMAG